MRWSWRIGKLAGIGVYMHFTFLILLGWVALAHYFQRRNVGDAIDGLIFIVALFAIVVLHELGHALMARKFGIPTRDITLLPIGGVARLERMPEEPKQELLVALAGPAVNVLLAAVLLLYLLPSSALSHFNQVEITGGDFLSKLLWINVALAGFNLIPAFPMDGGRVLRALLATRMDYVRATSIAAATGQSLALVFGFIGLFFNPFLVFIALFVWMGAAQESSMVMVKSALQGIPVSHLMITNFDALGPEQPLSEAIQKVLAGSQQDFPVLENGSVVGVLTQANLLSALASGGQEISVEEAMERKFETAETSEMAQTVFERLQSCNCHSLPVLKQGRLVGLVTTSNLGEFLLIQKALHEHRADLSSAPA